MRANRVAGLARPLRRAARVVRRADARIVRRYFAQTRDPKLHLGCGTHVLAGWLNADRAPRRASVLRLDATRAFPFPADTFAYVYSEHLIGSLSSDGAAAMLQECCRVLVPGGKVRIATPDLAFLSRLAGNELSAAQQRYVQWFHAQTGALGRCRSHDGRAAGAAGGFVVNQYMSAWELEVVYDEPMLHAALEAAGFCATTRRELAESDEAALRGLANEERMPAGLLRLESLTVEATKKKTDVAVLRRGGAARGRVESNKRRLNGTLFSSDQTSSDQTRLLEKGPPRIDPRRVVRRAYTGLGSLPRTLRRADGRIVRCHFAQTREPKLHLGCGDHLLDGWLNTDRWPRCHSVARLDASRRFPLPDNSFVYVYSEHMIASLSFSEARTMLRECHRVLAPGGKLRVATTDLSFLIRLYQALVGACGSDRSALDARYARWAGARRMAQCGHNLCRAACPARDRSDDNPEHALPVAAGVFLNHHLHTDVVRLVYSASMLSGMLAGVGFANITRCDPVRSETPAFCGLANERRMPDGFYRLECLTLEGTKPSCPPPSRRRCDGAVVSRAN